MKRYINDQRGVAMVVELVLVAVVIGAVGLAFVASKHAKQTATANPQAAAVGTPSAVPNGSVDNAVNAFAQDAGNDSTSASADSAVPASDTAENPNENMSGSYDETSF